jgi:hypothetical protein
MDAGIEILSSERHLLASHYCLIGSAFGGIPMAVFAGPGIQELNPVDVDEISEVLGTRVFVVPRLRTLPTFEINAGAFMQILADDLRTAAEGLYGKPLRVFLQCAALVLPSFSSGDGNCAMAVPCWLYFTSGSRPRLPINITSCMGFLLLLSTSLLLARYEHPLVPPYVMQR